MKPTRIQIIDVSSGKEVSFADGSFVGGVFGFGSYNPQYAAFLMRKVANAFGLTFSSSLEKLDELPTPPEGHGFKLVLQAGEDNILSAEHIGEVVVNGEVDAQDVKTWLRNLANAYSGGGMNIAID